MPTDVLASLAVLYSAIAAELLVGLSWEPIECGHSGQRVASLWQVCGKED